MNTKAPRLVSPQERAPLYAAYRAAHAEAERLGGEVYDDRIIQAAVNAYAHQVGQARSSGLAIGDHRIELTRSVLCADSECSCGRPGKSVVIVPPGDSEVLTVDDLLVAVALHRSKQG